MFVSVDEEQLTRSHVRGLALFHQHHHNMVFSESGKYTVQIFVWESLGSAIPLTPVIQTKITVH